MKSDDLVPGAGLEPARSFLRGILSPLRLPISPPGLGGVFQLQDDALVEAEPGVEPR